MSSSSGLENKWAALLQPVKDLAAAWSVDVASELQLYLAELEHIRFTYEDPNSLNFAQAGLLVAGSAAVFSRKVDYLHSLVFQTLDLITTKREQKARKQRQRGAAANDDEAWAELVASGEDNEALLSLDDMAVASDAASLLLADDEELILGPSLLAGTSKLAVMRQTRVGALSSYDAAATSRRAALLLRRATAAASAASGSDPFGSTFRINSCRVHPSGAVVLDAADAARPFANASAVHVGTVMSQSRHRSMTAADQRSVLAMTPGLKSARSKLLPLDNPPASPYRAADDNVGFGDGGFGAEDFDDAPDVQRAMLFDGAPPAQQQQQPDDTSDDTDVWTFLDMHDALSNESAKPFRMGNTRQNVDAQLAKARAAHDASTAALLEWPKLPSDVYVDATDAQLSALLRNVTLAEFAPARQRALQQMRRAAGPHADADEDDDDNNNEVAADPVAPVVDDFGGGFGDVGGFEEAAPAAPVPDVTFADVPQESYEELCRRYVDNYMQRAASYARQTEVSKRVATWTERIEPLLDEQAARQTFDIHAESKQILDQIGERRATDISFGELCAGAPKWDVCRRFVASLQLVNSKNLAIVRVDKAPVFRVLSLEPAADVGDAVVVAEKKTKRKALQRHNGPASPAAIAKRGRPATGQENNPVDSI